MGIGTSLGSYYDDEHHFHSRGNKPVDPGDHAMVLDPEINDLTTKDNNVVGPDDAPLPDAKYLDVSNHSGFRISDNIEDRRKEFYDPRTDPRSNNLIPGSYNSEDLPLTGDEPNTQLGRDIGNTSLDVARVKQIDEHLSFMKEMLDKAEKKWGPTDIGESDLPTNKSDPRLNPTTKFAGQLEEGNIDLHNRPVVDNLDLSGNPTGMKSTVRSISFGTDKGEVLIPTVHKDGYIMTDEAAMQHYYDTKEHLGVFDTPENADAYAKQLHEDQAKEYIKE